MAINLCPDGVGSIVRGGGGGGGGGACANKPVSRGGLEVIDQC